MRITEEIKGKSRKNDIVVQRAIVCKQLRDLGFSYPSIGKKINRHHTSVMYLVKQYKDWLESKDPLLMYYLQK